MPIFQLPVYHAIFVNSQLMRFIVTIDTSGNYTLEGIPATHPMAGDEVLPSQLEWLKVQEQYGIWNTKGTDYIFAGLDAKIGRYLNQLKQPKPFKYEGQIDPIVLARVRAQQKPLVKPGGVWILPVSNVLVTDVLGVQIRAYPTFPTDPAIMLVDVTINIAGGWQSILTLNTPVNAVSKLYQGSVSLKDVQIASGNYKVTFNVYDVEWRREEPANHCNLAPHGARHINYQP